MANQLRNYQALTVGDTIALTHSNREYQFNVIKVKPPTNEDAPKEKEFQEAMDTEGQSMEDVSTPKLSDSDYAQRLHEELNGPTQPAAQEQPSSQFPWAMYGISIIDTDVAVDVIEPLEPIAPVTVISLDSDKPQEGQFKEGQYAYFALKLPSSVPDGILIQVLLLSALSVFFIQNPQYPLHQVESSNGGDVDLYASHTGETRRPNQMAHTWKTTQGVS